MFIKYWIIWWLLNIGVCDHFDFYGHDSKPGNTLACPDYKICTPVNYCSDIVGLLNEGSLPVHRFRQAVCGYIGTNPKVCCNSPRDLGNYPPRNDDNYPMETRPVARECGRSLVRSSAPTLGSYPFLAMIGFINLDNGSINYSCIGTILNERTVLTTATCALATDDAYKLHSVLVGEFDTSTDPDCNSLFCAHCSHSHNISYVVKHPNFHAETYDRNIALLRLNEPITFTLTVQPICYSDQQYIPIGSTSMLVGWGKLSKQQQESTQQQSLPMKILRVQDCAEFIKRQLQVELCAIGYQDPCSGYSGSPMISRDGSGYTVIGILSYGPKCDSNENLPTVFVNIQKYAIWISENS